MPWPVKSVLALASLPIFTACALTLYYYHMKDREWKNYLRNLRKEEIEVAIPLSSVGTLIGRGGENIKELQEITQTRIKCKNPNDDKTMIIQVFGDKENILEAKKLILEKVQPKKNTEVFVMFVPEFAFGRIVGRCGDNIRGICRSSGAQVTVEKSKARDSKIPVTIKGNKNEIAKAKALVEEKVKEASDRPLLTYIKAGNRGKTEEASVPRCEVLPSFANGGRSQVYVSSVASPSNFWVQLISPRAVELDHLVEDMTEYYSKPENQKLHKLKEVKKGQILASKFEHDEKWYRVEVFDVQMNSESPDLSQVDVFFVDYGDSSFYKLEELLELKQEYLNLKFQAIEVSMYGIRPLEKSWDNAAIEVFTDMVHSAQWKAMLLQVISFKEVENSTRKDPVPLVKLYDMDSKQGLDIGTQFIKKGFAIRDEIAELSAKKENCSSDDEEEDSEDIWDV